MEDGTGLFQLFSTGGVNASLTGEGESYITEYEWTLPPAGGFQGCSERIISLYYALSYLAPGHGDVIWNSSKSLASLFHDAPLRSKLFPPSLAWPPALAVELGAGSALPSWSLLACGVPSLVVTDRASAHASVFDALKLAADKNSRQGLGGGASKVHVLPHSWGEDIGGDMREVLGAPREEGSTIVVASDCIYNPAFHKALLDSAKVILSTGVKKDSATGGSSGWLLIGFSLHGNAKDEDVLGFFDTAKIEGFNVVGEVLVPYDHQEAMQFRNCEAKRACVTLKVLELVL